ncbi:MAG: hypothetical protein EXR86_13070 [Gammaproteobacteria bacterium]|nr:hypothetical protein [Gammaproteobacteria bacterium]
MSAVELLYGSRDGSTLGAAPILEASSREEVKLTDVEIHYCLFELPMAKVLPRLPTSLHPSVPAVIGLTVWRCPDGPLGRFSLAYVGVACRTGIKPRHFIHGAFCDSAEVSGWLARRYGLACRAAEIHSLGTYDRIYSEITVGGQRILELSTTGMQPLVGRGGMVKYSPILNAARIEYATVLVQMETSFEFKRVVRGVPSTGLYAAADLGDATLAPAYPISGTFSIVDVTLHAPRFKLDVSVPAERGGAAKL